MIGQNVLLAVGCALVAVSIVLYAATWSLMILKPSWLLGNITMLWLRALVRTLTIGLIVVLLAALDEIVATVLFWRT
jgi:hypothetical protein